MGTIDCEAGATAVRRVADAGFTSAQLDTARDSGLSQIPNPHLDTSAPNRKSTRLQPHVGGTMKSKIFGLCVALLVLLVAAPHAQRGAAGPVTAIVGARLVDGTGAAAVNDSVILVSGDRITAAGPRASVQVPRGATVVNASGKTVMPGLVDVHCHLNQPADVMRKLLPVALNWGVTTIRMVGNDKPEIMQVYYDAKAGKFPSPRVYTAGPGFNLTGPYPGAPTLKPTTPEEARKGVQAHKALKVDFIKLWMADKGGFAPEIVEAIVDEAKKQNIPVVAHIGNVAQVKQLADL